MSISAAELLDSSSSSFPSPAPAELGATWFIARARPRQAKLLAEDLAARGVRCYFPTTTQLRYYAGRAASVRVPLFGDMVFVFGTPLNLAQVQRTGRALELLPVADCVLMTRQLRQVDAALHSGAAVHVCDHDGIGAAVEVRRGPLQGIRGVLCESTDHSETLLALPISALGRAVVIDISDAEIGAASSGEAAVARAPELAMNRWHAPAPG